MKPDPTTDKSPNTAPSGLEGLTGKAWSGEGQSFNACLWPLLDSLGWMGEQSRLFEALPHFEFDLDASDFIDVMAHLNFIGRRRDMPLNRIDPRLMPCLFIPHRGGPMVLIKGNQKRLIIFDGQRAEYRTVRNSRLRGAAIFFSRPDRQEEALTIRQAGWFSKLIKRFTKPLGHSILITFLLSLLAVVTPLFIMTLYDQMPFLDSRRTLAYMIIGVGIFILSDFGLRLLRTNVLGFIGARLGNLVSNEVFRRILYLPPAFTESAGIGAQFSRLRDFDSVREFISGPAGLALLETPFVVILVLAITAIGGQVVLAPLSAIALFVGFALAMAPPLKRINSALAVAGSRKQELVLEMATKMRAIKYSCAGQAWLSRYREYSAEQAWWAHRYSRMMAVINVATNALIMIAGVGTMGLGVINVLAGRMSMGALVASMILTWRVLAPLRNGFVVIMQLGRLRKSIGQVNRLMNFDLESRIETQGVLSRPIRGDIGFNQVSVRYSPNAFPALLGVTFQIKRGEVLAVQGHDGAGKSTLLKLIMGMYQAQSGRVLIDGVGLLQFDPITLRRSIAYAPQDPCFFYGTIEQNLKLANPMANKDEIETACALVGLTEAIDSLPQGLSTRIGDQSLHRLPYSVLARLNLARALLRPASICLFDESLDRAFDQDEATAVRLLDDLRYNTTIVVVSSRPDVLQAADKILWLEKGRTRMFGPAAEVTERMAAVREGRGS